MYTHIHVQVVYIYICIYAHGEHIRCPKLDTRSPPTKLSITRPKICLAYASRAYQRCQPNAINDIPLFVVFASITIQSQYLNIAHHYVCYYAGFT